MLVLVMIGVPQMATGADNRVSLDRAALVGLLTEALHDKVDGASWTVLPGQSTISLKLPADGHGMARVADITYEKSRNFFTASLTAGEDVVTVTGRVNTQISLPVPVRRIELGEVVRAVDLEDQLWPADRVSGDAIQDAGSLIGKEARRALLVGQPLRRADVQAERLVLRGKPVTVEVRSPILHMSMQGRAQQDGAKGEVVRILNTQSNRTIEAVVIGSGLVEVNLPQESRQTAQIQQTQGDIP